MSLIGVIYALLLAGEINASFFRKAEGVEVIVEDVLPHVGPYGNEGRVAGVNQRLGEVFSPVAPCLGTSHYNPVNFHRTRAVKAGGKAGTAAVKGGGGGNYLENGTGFIQVVYGLVSPLFLPSLGKSPVALVFIGYPHYFIVFVFVKKSVRIVGVKGRVNCHAQDTASLYVHDYSHSPLLGIVSLGGLRKALFQVVLYGLVYRGEEAVAVAGLVQDLIVGAHILAYSVAGGDHPPGFSGELAVVVALKSR